MKLLHVDSSILGDNSVTRTLSADIVARLKSTTPGLEVTYRDLGKAPVTHLSGPLLAAVQSPDGQHSPEVQADLAESGAVLQEVLDADIVVVGVAFYNFSIPSQLKAWVDRIVVAGKTFRYSAEGRPEGLLGDKRFILAIARGGFYGKGSPIESFEHAETYLRTVLGFIGVTNIEVIAAEGIAIGPEQRQKSVAEAEQQITALVA